MGLACGRHAYLTSGWNVMDGCLVAISLIDTDRLAVRVAQSAHLRHPARLQAAAHTQTAQVGR